MCSQSEQEHHRSFISQLPTVVGLFLRRPKNGPFCVFVVPVQQICCQPHLAKWLSLKQMTSISFAEEREEPTHPNHPLVPEAMELCLAGAGMLANVSHSVAEEDALAFAFRMLWLTLATISCNDSIQPVPIKFKNLLYLPGLQSACWLQLLPSLPRRRIGTLLTPPLVGAKVCCCCCCWVWKINMNEKN
jgi:hypothetical protein